MVHCLKNAVAVDGLDLMDRGFHYGDGCFSTARLYKDVVLLKHRHWQRIKIAAEQLCLNVDLDILDQSLHALIDEHAALNGTLKILISRGIGERGYTLPTHPADIYFFYYPSPQLADAAAQQAPRQSCFAPIEYIETGVLALQMGLSMPSLVGLKSLNRLEQVMLRQQADEMQWSEALVTDLNQHIVEGVSSNLFILMDDGWITPELRYNGVHGVMRAEILARMQHYGIDCRQRFVAGDEIDQIQSLFFCNALTPMKIAKSLATRPLAIQPCVELLQTLQLDQIQSYV